MNSPSDPATGGQLFEKSAPVSQSGITLDAHVLSPPGRVEAHTSGARFPDVKVGRRAAFVGGKETEVFTMTLGVESIELLPLRNWGQLDIYKWRVRGKLPGTPAGLEITFDHVKLLGETVSLKDSEGCAKLERLFSEWLAVERESLELARKKAQTKAAALAEAGAAAGQQLPHFEVEVDNKGMVHVRCLQGKESVAAIGLNAAGFQSLISQGFMRKPRAIKTGALHDWVELDGMLFSFEKGNNDAAKLQEALNRSYLPASGQGRGKEVVVHANAASSTGFDIQFPAKSGGLTENRRRPLTEETLDLLQDPDHCGLLHPGIVIKLTRPTLIFKKKTPDGGERYLDRSSANTVRVVDEDSVETLIDLSQPVNYLHLSAVELTAVFNHPSINRHTQAAPTSLPNANVSPCLGKKEQPPAIAALDVPPSREALNQAPSANGVSVVSDLAIATRVTSRGETMQPSDTTVQKTTQPHTTQAASPKPPAPSAELGVSRVPRGKTVPNSWLKPILEQQPIRYDWLTCLIYGSIATRLGNSREGELFGRKCWFVEMNATEPEREPLSDLRSELKAIFLEANGGFGFVNGNWFCLFEKERATVGSNESSLKAEPVRLLGAGIAAGSRFVFLVGDGYRASWDVPEAEVDTALAQLKEKGAILLSTKEALESSEPLEVVWTVPVEQPNPSDPQALESTRPDA